MYPISVFSECTPMVREGVGGGPGALHIFVGGTSFHTGPLLGESPDLPQDFGGLPLPLYVGHKGGLKGL